MLRGQLPRINSRLVNLAMSATRIAAAVVSSVHDTCAEIAAAQGIGHRKVGRRVSRASYGVILEMPGKSANAMCPCVCALSEKIKENFPKKKRASRKKQIKRRCWNQFASRSATPAPMSKAKRLRLCGSARLPRLSGLKKKDPSPENFTAAHYPACCRLRRRSRA